MDSTTSHVRFPAEFSPGAAADPELYLSHALTGPSRPWHELPSQVRALWKMRTFKAAPLTPPDLRDPELRERGTIYITCHGGRR